MTFDIPESIIRQILSKVWPGRWVVMPIHIPRYYGFVGEECGILPSAGAASYHELRFPNLGRRQARSCMQGHARSEARSGLLDEQP